MGSGDSVVIETLLFLCKYHTDYFPNKVNPYESEDLGKLSCLYVRG